MNHKEVARRTVLATAAGVVVLAACSGPDLDGSALPFEDDFSGECRWPEEENANVSLRCAFDAYAVVLKRPSQQSAEVDLDAAAEAIRVEADAKVIRGAPSPSAPTGTAVFGLGCWEDEEQGYVFRTFVDGTFEIAREGGEGRIGVPLARGSVDAERVVHGRLAAECVTGSETTTLSLSLDGMPVLTARDARQAGPFAAIGVFAGSPVSGLEARFDNISADELSEEDIAAVEGRPAGDRSMVALPFADDFSDRGSGWLTGENGQLSLGYADEGYRMRLWRAMAFYSVVPLGRSVEGVEVDVTAILERGPTSTTGGVVCLDGDGDGDGFRLAVSASGEYAIARERPEQERPRILLEGAIPEHVPPGVGVRLHATCERTPDGAELNLFVGSSLTAETVDLDWSSPFEVVGLYAAADEPGARVFFDDFEAREMPSAP